MHGEYIGGNGRKIEFVCIQNEGEFLDLMVLPRNLGDVENCLREVQKRLDCSSDNCMCRSGCLFEADEILNRIISAHGDPGNEDKLGQASSQSRPCTEVLCSQEAVVQQFTVCRWLCRNGRPLRIEI
jgi:hypothetical protein